MKQYPRLSLCLTIIISLCLTGAAVAGASAYRVHTTGSLQLFLPAAEGLSRVMYRDASNTWQPMQVTTSEGVAEISVNAEKIRGGRTVLLLDVADHVDLDDREPPQVRSLQIDGKSYGATSRVDLGGVDAPPDRLRVEIADDKNWLRRRSLSISANGRRIDPRSDAVALARRGPRKAVIVVNLSGIFENLSRDNHLTISMDDYAIDDTSLTCTVTFKYVEPHHMDDGTVISVDSVTSASGWQDWTVIVDGEVMSESSGTTAGKTWLSEPNDLPHWVKMEFPQAREISQVKLWWAYYETYRTSRAYQIQTWDGGEWVTQAEVQDQGERQCSTHQFDPVTTTAVRIWQPPHSGQAGRSEYMWLSEIEVQ
ncbi:MAG: hypothetical protein R6V19_01215 [Armatimonadota bacterium]